MKNVFLFLFILSNLYDIRKFFVRVSQFLSNVYMQYSYFIFRILHCRISTHVFL